jgi:hypothetical protein
MSGANSLPKITFTAQFFSGLISHSKLVEGRPTAPSRQQKVELPREFFRTVFKCGALFAVRQAMRSGRGGRCVAGWLLVRGLFAMRGPMRAGWLHSRGALRCTGCDAMRCDARDARQCAALPVGCDARADALRTGCDAMRCAARDAMREPMRCELVAMQCAARGLVAFARCRRRHAF